MKLRQWDKDLVLVLLVILPTVLGCARDVAPEQASKESIQKEEGLPLKPERTVEFTTDEGTWLSLDVSPDGKTIVFDLLGDIYTLPIEGGTATPITRGMAFDSQPRYSPDGKLIAFLSDRNGAENLWVARADGTDPRKLTREKNSLLASPTWTPGGEYIILSRRPFGPGGFELWMYHIAGGSGIQITRAEPKPNTPADQRHNALGAVASADGRYLYYARRIGGALIDVTFPLWQIARRDLSTGVEDVLTQAEGSAIRPVLSPDGSKLVYGTRHEAETGLRILDLPTGEERSLAYPVQRDDQESRATRDLLPGYAFTPDGTAVILSYGGKIHRVNVSTSADAQIPFSADVSVGLGPLLDFPSRVEDGPVRVRVIDNPTQSSDGGRLAFSALGNLYVMETGGGAPRPVTPAGTLGYQPAWSPDGEWLAYVTWSNEGGHIWKVRTDGEGVPQQLTQIPSFYRDPVWSPDGLRIVALRAPRQARLGRRYKYYGAVHGLDVIWVPAEGGEASLITPARGMGQPHFTNQMDRIYLSSSEGLISMRLDGTDRRTEIKVVGKGPGPEPNPAQDIRMSPDGRRALALVANQLSLVAVPHVGGQPVKVNIDSGVVPVEKLTDVGADYFAWADGGATITWALGSSFFRIPLASVSFGAEGIQEAPATKGQEEPRAERIEIVLEHPRYRPEGTVVLRGAKVITMRGGEVISNADVVVTDNRITGVWARGQVVIPENATVFDVSGTTIMPGMVDTHSHWREVERGVLDSQSWRLVANLAYGVTAGRDPQTFTNDMFTYQDLIDAGESVGPRAFSTGPGVFFNSDFHSLEDAKNVVTKYKRFYRTNTLKSYNIGNRRQRQWMVQACKELKMMPTTEGARDFELELTHVIDGFSGNEHSFPIVPIYRDVVELVARSGLTYTPTLLVAYGGPQADSFFYVTTEVHDDPKLQRFIPDYILDARSKRRPWFRREEQVFPRLAAAAADIVRRGGRVGVGSHGQLQGISFHWEMWALASGGLTNLEVLRAATLHGAEAIGYAQDLGSIEIGKLADLLVLEKDPLEDIRNTNTIRYVMKNGELFEGNTLDQVWPEKKPLQPLWWWNDEP